MNKIYTITLDDEVPLSEKVISDIKQVVYILFDKIDSFDRKILVFDDEKSNLKRNQLLEIKNNGEYIYFFESEHSLTDNYRYEPFIINNRSFGFTVYDGSIEDEEVRELLNYSLNFLKLNYKFNIDSSLYYDDDIASARLSAYNYMVYGIHESKNDNKNIKKKAKVLSNPLMSLFS